ncbi:hypothetical protein HDU93_003023 [Gonapodya sp. JEL0774]|nr:hypothetical protein HDU93_003023 [Gonapodya sp. JEL0774]
MESAITHFLRRSLADGYLYANIQEQRKAMDSLPFPTPKGVHISKIFVPKRLDVFDPLMARSKALDVSRGWFNSRDPTPQSTAQNHLLKRSTTSPSLDNPARPGFLRSLSSPTMGRKGAIKSNLNSEEWVECEVVENRGNNKEWDGNGPVILYIHGGAYTYTSGRAWIIGSPKSHRFITTHLAKKLNARVVGVHYGLAPEHPFPEAAIDVVSAYAYLTLKDAVEKTAHPESAIFTGIGVAGCGVDKGVHFGGDSAGGNLSLTLLHLIALGLTPPQVFPFETGSLPPIIALPKPMGTFLLSPATELTFSNPDYQLNRFDYLPWLALPDVTKKQVHAYCTNPDIVTSAVSPGVWGWFGNPSVEGGNIDVGPILVQVGQAERLWGQGLTTALRLAHLGRPVRFESYENQPHVFHILTTILKRPAGARAMESIENFIKDSSAGKIVPDARVSFPTPDHTDPPIQCFFVDPKTEVHSVAPQVLREQLRSLRERVVANVGNKEHRDKKFWRRDRNIPRSEIWNGYIGEWYDDMGRADWSSAEVFGIPDDLKEFL